MQTSKRPWRWAVRWACARPRTTTSKAPPGLRRTMAVWSSFRSITFTPSATARSRARITRERLPKSSSGGITMRLIATGSQFLAAGTTLLASLVLLTGCKSKPSISEESKQPAPANTVAADHFDGGTYCVQTFLEGPPLGQPLHFSNQVVESDPAMKTKDFQADLSGDNVDLVHRDKWLATDADRALFEDTKRFDDPKVIVRNITNGIEEETVTNHAT